MRYEDPNTSAIQAALEQVAITADRTPPTVTLSQPLAQSLLRATTSVTGQASDDATMDRVDFLLDGQPVAPPVTAPPYGVSWNTQSFADGEHTLVARAFDLAGNVSTARVQVTIDNTPPRVILRAEPQEVWGSTGAMVPIQIDVQLLTDNLDASPSIRLVQVTASQPMAGDVADATLGTDDRSLAVRATCVGLQRVYTILFEGTDRAGNVTQAATTVTIVRDMPPPPQPEDPPPPGE